MSGDDTFQTHKESWSRRSRVLWSAVFFLAALAAVSIDLTITKVVQAGSLPGDVSRILDVSEFFAHGFGVAVIAIGILVLVPEHRRFVPRVLTCALLPGLVVNLCKFSIGRFRPIVYNGELPESIADTWCGAFLALNQSNHIAWSHPVQSFPSGHAATAFGLAIGLTWLYPRGKYLFMSLAVLAAMQRIVSQSHWASDVFAGISISILIAGGIAWSERSMKIFSKIERRSAATHLDDQSSTLAA